MDTWSRILFPTDFSEAANCALPHALELARRFDAELILTHIRTPYTDDPNRPEYHYFDAGKYTSFVEGELQKASEVIQEHHRVVAVMGRNVSPASGILEIVVEQSADLIVMGTHGRSGLGRFFLGSVAEKVVRHAEVPVLTVASKRDGYRNNPEYRRILAAYDFSLYSKEASFQARRIAEAFKAELCILYVIEQEIHPGYYDVWKVAAREEMAQIAEKARRSLGEVLGVEGLAEVDVQVAVGEGDGKVHRDLSTFAKEREYDLIVMGTYGLSGIEHMLLGSTTEKVVRIAPCPVLTFHVPRK